MDLALDGAAASSGGDLLVRVDSLEAGGGIRLEGLDPAASGAASLTVRPGAPGTGCVGRKVDSILFRVSAEPMARAWLRVRTDRPARVRVRPESGGSGVVSPDVLPGGSAMVPWPPAPGGRP